MKGEASGALDSYPTTFENYDIAIEAIKNRFGRNQAIICCHLKDLLSGEKNEPNIKQLGAFLDKMIAKKAILALAQNNVEWEQVFVQITLCNTKKNSKTKRVDFGIFGGAEHEYEIYFFLSRQVFSAFYMLI